MQWPFPPATYIEHDRDFDALVRHLEQQSLIALDTEANSLYAYRERICLVQISTRQADFIIDPLRIVDMSPLRTVLANPAVQKVFHAAENDIIALKRDYDLSVSNPFDTMIAARICGRREMGLDKLLGEFCGVEAKKNHQRDDWGQRPLPEEGLLYAQMDTHYLPVLRDALLAELEQMGRLVEAQEIFADMVHVTVPDRAFDPEGYWRLGIPASLKRREMTILRELYLLREVWAQERDVPPFKVIMDRPMVAIAEAAPNTMRELERVKGLARSQIRRYGRELLEAVERGKRAPMPHPPMRPPSADPAAVERFTLLREWRRDRALQRGVESDIIVSKDALWDVALKAPRTLAELQGIRGLGPWRLATYGEDILNVLQHSPE